MLFNVEGFLLKINVSSAKILPQPVLKQQHGILDGNRNTVVSPAQRIRGNREGGTSFYWEQLGPQFLHDHLDQPRSSPTESSSPHYAKEDLALYCPYVYTVSKEKDVSRGPLLHHPRWHLLCWDIRTAGTSSSEQHTHSYQLALPFCCL